MIEALDNSNLFGGVLRQTAASWAAWRTFLAALFALPRFPREPRHTQGGGVGIWSVLALAERIRFYQKSARISLQSGRVWRQMKGSQTNAPAAAGECGQDGSVRRRRAFGWLLSSGELGRVPLANIVRLE